MLLNSYIKYKSHVDPYICLTAFLKTCMYVCIFILYSKNHICISFLHSCRKQIMEILLTPISAELCHPPKK